ncbi:OmpW family protein [Chelatococcus sambhunathii]|uniref:OmpW family protein n=1 Tax=Chelatococcus sambhunathii TaxID=363953 RepID=A0ABU1DGL2_9HYPH|nr:OmpW family protein [Chelatococcus sambhunathii]MDR4307191.1 OmpW family protein [Chelatococcus sambhunathii]
MKLSYALSLALLASTWAIGPARAADIPETPSFAATPPADWSRFMVRGRVIGVLPHSSAKLNIPGRAHISDDVMPEVDLSYFFTPNLAVEVICCASKHKITGRGALAGLKIGDTWVIPATVTAQYHFTNFGAFKPYVGVGLNYSIYFNEDSGPGLSGLKLKNSVGVATQVGFDYMIDEHWGVNLDLKKIYMEPKIRLEAGGADVRGRAKINPWVTGAGVTYRF